MGSPADCETCEDTYDGDPPCDGCEHEPVKILPDNFMAITLWSTLSFHDRPVSMSGALPIPTVAISNLCETCGASIHDFQKIMDIEKIIFPAIRDQKTPKQNDSEDE